MLALILESLRAVVGVDEDALEPTLMGQLADVLLDVWAKNVKGTLASFRPLPCPVSVSLTRHP